MEKQGWAQQVRKALVPILGEKGAMDFVVAHGGRMKVTITVPKGKAGEVAEVVREIKPEGAVYYLVSTLDDTGVQFRTRFSDHVT